MKSMTCSTFAWIAIGMMLLLGLALFPQSASAAQRCDLVVQLVSESETPASLEPGEVFRKSFRLRERNECGWADGLRLVFVGGDRMSGPSKLDLRSPKLGQVLEISFDLQAPNKEGDYSGAWQLALNGQRFGPVLAVNLLVQAGSGDPQIANPGGGEDEGPGPELPEGVPGPETILVVAEAWSTVPAGSLGFSSVQCTEGVVTGGGWTLMGAYLDPRVYRSRKSSNGWSVSARNESDTDTTLRAYAVCLKNTQGTTFEVTQQVDVENGEFEYDLVSCPAGSVRAGGGFDVYAYNGMDVQVSSPGVDNDGWWLRVINNSFVPETALNAIVCLSGTSATSDAEQAEPFQVKYMYEQVNPGYGVAACPTGTIASSGGMGFADFIYFESMLIDNNTWKVLALNPHETPENQTPPYMYASVNCLDFP